MDPTPTPLPLPSHTFQPLSPLLKHLFPCPHTMVLLQPSSSSSLSAFTPTSRPLPASYAIFNPSIHSMTSSSSTTAPLPSSFPHLPLPDAPLSLSFLSLFPLHPFSHVSFSPFFSSFYFVICSSSPPLFPSALLFFLSSPPLPSLPHQTPLEALPVSPPSPNF